ncbi:hypothetical protein EV361DRAFT_918862 [Lentinula raphanica]|nr:hypothetical protein EV361DRAFT_918862 [Lentinula raphanica]
MHARKLFYVFFVISSILVVSILDAFNQTCAEERVWNGIYIDITILLWIPLSFFMTIWVLRGCISEISDPILPLQKNDRNLESTGQPEDFIILLGFGHTWLMFSRLSYVIFDQFTFTSTIPSPLLFAFCHGPKAIFALSLFTAILFGICLQSCGIGRERWGYFLYVYLMVIVPLGQLAVMFRWSIALLEGRIGILEIDRYEEEVVPVPNPSSSVCTVDVMVQDNGDSTPSEAKPRASASNAQQGGLSDKTLSMTSAQEKESLNATDML